MNGMFDGSDGSRANQVRVGDINACLEVDVHNKVNACDDPFHP